MIAKVTLALVLFSLLTAQGQGQGSNNSFRCNSFTDCVTCIESSQATCVWIENHHSCVNSTDYFHYESPMNTFTTFSERCVNSYIQDAPVDDFLSNWMRELTQHIGHATLLDLSLPGTHDSLTYNLSLKVSDGGIDGMDKFSELVHEEDKLVPNKLSSFIRRQAQTHALNITGQLNPPTCLPLYLPTSLPAYRSIYLCIYLSINLSINLSIYQSINLSIYLSIYQSIYQSINQSIYLPISLSP